MKVGIVGNEGAKFTPETENKARELIRWLLLSGTECVATAVVSGHCHLGGIDIWAEEEADKLGLEKKIFPPKHFSWDLGYKPRNILIANTSDVVHNIVLAKYPESFVGKRWKECYHCIGSGRPWHVKSGGCWTAKHALKLGKPAYWHII